MFYRISLTLLISFRVFAAARAASTATCKTNVSVLHIERMAVFAMRFCRHDLPRSADDVFGCADLVVDHAKMLDVTTGPIATLMIDLHTWRDRPNIPFPNVAMNSDQFAVVLNLAVSVAVFAASKDVARPFQIGSWARNFIVFDPRRCPVWSLRRMDREKWSARFGLPPMGFAKPLRVVLPSTLWEVTNTARIINGRHGDLLTRSLRLDAERAVARSFGFVSSYGN